MQGLAAWIMRGPAQASALAGAALILGIALPPFAWISSAMIALVLLSAGPAGAVRVALPALVVAAAAGWLLTGAPYPVALMGLASWLPVVLVAGMLRATARIELALLTAVLLGWLIVLGLHAAVADPVAAWQEWLGMMVGPDGLSGELDLDSERVATLIERLAPLMTGLLAASTVTSSVTATFLGRWWQAALYNPGGFRREFHGLRLGRIAAGVTLGLMALATLTGSVFVFGLAAVAGTAYLVQGLAVVHGLVAVRGMHSGWLIGMYVLGVVMFVQMALALIVLGLVDAWLDLRGRARGHNA